MQNKNTIAINKLLSVMKKLRDPKSGCPWDKKQTFESIIPYSIEEIYEVAEEIYQKNYINLKGELGDLLFQVVYLSQIANEKKKFSFNDVVNSITKKMIYRHPHVFNNKKFKNMKEYNIWWDKSKKKNNLGILDGIPFTFPAMLRAYKIQKKVAKVGFDYSSNNKAIDKIIEEANELKKELKKNNKKKIKEELGDLIFACIDVSRKLNLNPEIILSKSNYKFTKRWKFIEKQIFTEKKDIKTIKINKLNYLWKKSKKLIN